MSSCTINPLKVTQFHGSNKDAYPSSSSSTWPSSPLFPIRVLFSKQADYSFVHIAVPLNGNRFTIKSTTFTPKQPLVVWPYMNSTRVAEKIKRIWRTTEFKLTHGTIVARDFMTLPNTEFKPLPYKRLSRMRWPLS
ncbi:unnamed protein product [Rodentolepis nana]|uniref:MSP domain-containing protein n=1 Tax=Rodentolepis nana TaxID=102285 RepID=A0A0R3TZC9_RODNA|nr:unnamed protein product [Rodentolepis nana]